MKNKFKYILIIIGVLFLVRQSYTIFIDFYNFKQLEKVKIILEDLRRNDKLFYTLKEFNEIYKSDIKPIKNCYYIRNNREYNKPPYIFGFKLESLIYIYIYGNIYYPKYNSTYKNNAEFKNIISNPCRDEKE